MMEIFADTANLQEIKEALEQGIIRGVTTNPAIMSKEPKANYIEHLRKIVELLTRYQELDPFYRGDGIHLSVEVFSRESEVIVRQASDFTRFLNYRHLAVKIQIGPAELSAIRRLAGRGLSINCTCCMKAGQAVLAAAAGAKFVSLFWGRIRDFGGNPFIEVQRTRALIEESYPGTKIIVGSIRQEGDIIEAGMAGADIVTVPPKFFAGMASHPKTDEAVDEFLTKFSEWQS